MPVWLGWVAGYALAAWVINTASSLAESRLNRASPHVREFVAMARFLIPLVLAFLIGFRLRAWWWVLGPFVAVSVPTLAFVIADYVKRSPADRRQAFGGVLFGIGAIAIDAAAAIVAAFAGVLVGRWWPDG